MNEAGSPSTTLVRGINPTAAVAIVVGSMIGSGIFIVPADIARQVGSPGLLLAVWVITGLVTVMGALTQGELAAMYPKAGGQYVYLREGLSPLWGFLYGWTLFLVIQTGTIAAVVVAFARFLGRALAGADAGRLALAGPHPRARRGAVRAVRPSGRAPGVDRDRRLVAAAARDRDRAAADLGERRRA